MAISTQTSTDYTNRQVDLEVWQSAVVPSEILRLSPTLTQKGVNRKVTGIQKLVQRYITLLSTIKGDTKFDSNVGSKFFSDTSIGGTYTREQLLHSFVFANADVVAQLRQEDDDPTYGTSPDDERISTATLVDYSVDQTGRVFIRVQLTSRKGSPVTFIVPAS